MPEKHRLLRILLLEDDPDDATIFSNMLKVLDPTGYVVTTATGKSMARDLLDREDFDLVISDYRLDQSDGGTSADFLLEVFQRSAYLPVLLFSAFLHAGVDERLRPFLEGGRLRLLDKDRLSIDTIEAEILQQLRSPYRVLLVAPENELRQHVATLLRSSHVHRFDVHEESSMELAGNASSSARFDIFLCAWRPGGEAFLLELAEQRPGACLVLLHSTPADDLPASLQRLVGRRGLAVFSAAELEEDRFEAALMHHLNRMAGAAPEDVAGLGTTA